MGIMKAVESCFLPVWFYVWSQHAAILIYTFKVIFWLWKLFVKMLKEKSDWGCRKHKIELWYVCRSLLCFVPNIDFYLAFKFCVSKVVTRYYTYINKLISMMMIIKFICISFNPFTFKPLPSSRKPTQKPHRDCNYYSLRQSVLTFRYLGYDKGVGNLEVRVKSKVLRNREKVRCELWSTNSFSVIFQLAPL